MALTKSHMPRGHQTTGIHSLTVLEARRPRQRCGQGWFHQTLRVCARSLPAHVLLAAPGIRGSQKHDASQSHGCLLPVSSQDFPLCISVA